VSEVSVVSEVSEVRGSPIELYLNAQSVLGRVKG